MTMTDRSGVLHHWWSQIFSKGNLSTRIWDVCNERSYILWVYGFVLFLTDSFIARCIYEKALSLLCKVLGIYQITAESANKKTVTHYVVMENLFYDQSIAYKFDLKGSNRNRYAAEGSRKSDDDDDDDDFYC